jgi:hypothetical protein
MNNSDTYFLLVGAGCLVLGIVGLFTARLSWLRRIIFSLLLVFYSAVSFASAFHTDLSAVTGISWSVIFIMLFFLPSIFICWDIWDEYFKRKHGPDA